MSTNRADLSPALHKAAEAVCVYDRTDGFCHPRNHPACRCWQIAEEMMLGLGLSANAVSWVVQHKHDIERQSREGAE